MVTHDAATSVRRWCEIIDSGFTRFWQPLRRKVQTKPALSTQMQTDLTFYHPLHNALHFATCHKQGAEYRAKIPCIAFPRFSSRWLTNCLKSRPDSHSVISGIEVEPECGGVEGVRQREALEVTPAARITRSSYGIPSTPLKEQQATACRRVGSSYTIRPYEK